MLASATIVVARAMEIVNEAGSLEAGKRAELVCSTSIRWRT